MSTTTLVILATLAVLMVIWAQGHTDMVHLYAAWSYCILRLLHSVIQVLVNHVWMRFSVFMLSWIALAVLLLREISLTVL